MKRRIAMVLVLALILAMLPALTATTAQAATKKETSRIIGIVFDNSGSMYNDHSGCDPKAWCRATYAMEVFAAMMNSTDELRIYPMHPIQVRGEEYDYFDPLVIKGPSESSKIRDIYTPSAGNTPFVTVTYAYQDLMQVSGFDEKYLIVLTDGSQLEMDYTGYDDAGRMLDDYSRDMEMMMYLAIGPNATELTPTRSNQFYDKASDTADVLQKLTAMCNQIFGRHQLVCASEDVLTFDVSMSKVIIFAQGANVTNAQVQGWDQTSCVPMKYSENGAGGRLNVVDDSLQGVIVTYEGELNKGTYNISYTGVYDSVCIYYEPDVDIQVRIIGADGEVDPSANLYAGEYTVEFYMVDREGDIVTSDLMGDVEFEINFTKNGVTETETIHAKSGSVQLVVEPGDTLDMEFVASYLDGYEIRKDGGDFGWPSTGITIEKDPSRDLFMEITGGADKYPLTKLEQEAVYHVALFHDGEQLTGEALKEVQEPIDISLAGGNAEYTVERTETGYEIRIRYHNSAKDTEAGEYTLTASATFVNKEGELITCKPVTKKFTIEDDAGKFAAEMEVPQDYYVLKDMENGKPIYINLTCGGAPLTAEQFQNAEVTVNAGAVPYELIPDEANSRYILKLQGSEEVLGAHNISIRVEGYDEIGRAVTCEDSHEVQIRAISRALRWIIIILIIAAVVILAVIFWKIYSSIKALPDNITVSNGEFKVGTQKKNRIDCGYDKANGTLEVKASIRDRGSCGVVLYLEKYSSHLEKSPRRKARVTGFSVDQESCVTLVEIGPASWKRSKDPSKQDPKPSNFEISNNATIKIEAKIPDYSVDNGGGEPPMCKATLKATLKFE